MRAYLKLAWQKVTLFRLLYWSVALATYRHSAIGLSTLESGSLVLGALGAIAIDIGMILAAERLRTGGGNRKWLIAGLILSASASVYSQLLYTVTYAEAVSVAPGAMWMENVAQLVIDMRVLVIPVLLPALAVVYSFASEVSIVHDEMQEPKSKAQWCRTLFRLRPEAGPTQVAAAASALTGEEVSVATASRAK